MTTSIKLLVSLLVFSGVTISLLSGRLLVLQRKTDNSDRVNSIENSATGKLAPSPTISSKSEGYKQGSVKSATKSTTQYPTENSDTKTSQIDQGKVVALQNAMLQAAIYKVSAEKIAIYKAEMQEKWLKCRDRVTEVAKESAAKGTPLSPGGIRDIEDTCKSGIQSLVNNYQAEYDKAMYQYNEYSRQVNQLLSECPTCAQYIKIKE